ncbi:MAG TPA: peptidyl-prolyl cis-trans isomerase [Candidatus Tenderia sp.]|nr:peptidyl-prolyl cis-trans isomerase [Candidatus Tenderia sp.]
MKTTFYRFAITCILFCLAPLAQAGDAHPRVLLETNQGDILLELDAKAAPATVENFIQYVESGFYNGTIFHRVISDFMIQGGGFTESFNKKQPRAAIKNEADNGLKNNRGTIAMARTSAPHSATAQFFINTVDNDFLNFSSPSMRGWGYAVFGKVVKGMDVVDKIRTIPTGSGGPFGKDVPRTSVIIEKATVVTDDDHGNHHDHH